ncbi:MAG: UDP-N-acetylmuramoyl-tripeptide--D-alanyl-D-alanine ligase [Betaproteobacteria bacterium RIFCSPLOWO2_02_FULL_62_17]|nr:MAG: UDP-N-acetylmuramoyl-tripeptide--D-alanyl-D-alanine ligase [Betaproteobacteria bacterium RIFCSPLOWO2_02_FULL_62_17]
MMSLAHAAHSLGARLVGADAHFHSVSTDSRKIERGALFVALRGERFDAHAFIDAVAGSGAAGAMVDHVPDAAPLPLLVVEDTRASLGKLAAAWRARFAIPLIAVAGSNGKTTVKEMIAAILREHFGAGRVLATEGNLNNDIGLPLTLLRLRDSHRAAVVEIGMNHPGETASLAAMARPTVALVNNAQREHQEFMKSVADVAREHAALPASLARGGVAVINADDPHAAMWREAAARAGAGVRDFGLGSQAVVHADFQLEQFSSRLHLHAPEGSVRIDLPVPGLHNVRNALAATSAAGAAGASLAAAARALGAFSAVKGRMQRSSTAGGAVLLDDSYNANPESVHAAIEVLAACPEPRVLVLGDMGEVGEHGPAFHAEVGEHARRARLTSLLAMGELTRHAVASFGGGRHAATLEDLLGALRAYDRRGATLLVKGSRFMRMERVVESLTGAAREEH